MNKVFSDAVEDEVYCTLYLPDGITGQLACNWTDSSYRKMETKLTIWGSDGHISVDRQEIRLYLRDHAGHETRHAGWTITNTSELTECPNFYLRGEEYSAQMDHFIHCIETGQVRDGFVIRFCLCRRQGDRDDTGQCKIAGRAGRCVDAQREPGD